MAICTGPPGSGGSANNNCGSGCGTVFKITLVGAFAPLANFNFSDGAQPYAALVQGKNGDLYGTTYFGGSTRCFEGCGTFFKVTTAGELTAIHRFTSYDGFNPNGLVLATDGNFYGTTQAGTVFVVTPGGKVTPLLYLGGRIPYAGLIQDTNGNFYGTTGAGFNCSAKGGDCGWVFEMSVGLSPFVATLPVAGKVGTKVTILGTDLTDVTGIRFNGTPAELVSVTSSSIATKVPSGATSGQVTVITSKTTLSSNVAFQVIE